MKKVCKSVNVPVQKWKWFGHAGHLLVASMCRFHLCTQVGRYLISTVGDYYPDGNEKKRETIGVGKGDYFETYVFNVRRGTRCKSKDCLCGLPAIDVDNIEGRRLPNATLARKHHLKTCAKYACRPVRCSPRE